MFLSVLGGSCSVWLLLEAGQEEKSWLNSGGLLEMLDLKGLEKKGWGKRDEEKETERFIREEPFVFNIHSGPCLGLFW